MEEDKEVRPPQSGGKMAGAGRGASGHKSALIFQHRISNENRRNIITAGPSPSSLLTSIDNSISIKSKTKAIEHRQQSLCPSCCVSSSSRRRHLWNSRIADMSRSWTVLSLSIIVIAVAASTCLAARVAGGKGAAPASNKPDEQQQQQLSPSELSELEKQSDYWRRSGKQALEAALSNKQNTQRAKNAILFIGDGMSLTTIAAARIFNGQLVNRSGEEELLSFEQLPNVGLVKTYNVDAQVPDSAATATAILCGVKANFYTLGVNANVRLDDTNCQKVQQNKVDSILKQAQEAGKSTGIITNTRITHATPAAAYAHSASRKWECGPQVPAKLEPPCKDIARQLIEDEPGNRLNVIMGGGRRCFFGPNFRDPGPSGAPGWRLDNENLIDRWIQQKKAQSGQNFAFVNSTRHLREVDTTKIDHLLGLFAFTHMNYEELRDRSLDGEPSLIEMIEVALGVLSKNPKGYVLLVEGGRIDHAHHENVAGVALRETISLHWAFDTTRRLVNESDTLLAVTSDHAHALTMNGAAPRGNPILGLTKFREDSTGLPYTTLLYGNGPGNHQPRPDPTLGENSTDSLYYSQYAAINLEEAVHDGSDVAVFAAGPFSHLFHGVQEQSYIAHVFAYALCLGDYTTAGLHCFESIKRSYQQADPSSLGRPTTIDDSDASSSTSSSAPPSMPSCCGPMLALLLSVAWLIGASRAIAHNHLG